MLIKKNPTLYSKIEPPKVIKAQVHTVVQKEQSDHFMTPSPETNMKESRSRISENFSSLPCKLQLFFRPQIAPSRRQFPNLLPRGFRRNGRRLVAVG